MQCFRVFADLIPSCFFSIRLRSLIPDSESEDRRDLFFSGTVLHHLIKSLPGRSAKIKRVQRAVFCTQKICPGGVQKLSECSEPKIKRVQRAVFCTQKICPGGLQKLSECSERFFACAKNRFAQFLHSDFTPVFNPCSYARL